MDVHSLWQILAFLTQRPYTIWREHVWSKNYYGQLKQFTSVFWLVVLTWCWLCVKMQGSVSVDSQRHVRRYIFIWMRMFWCFFFGMYFFPHKAQPLSVVNGTLVWSLCGLSGCSPVALCRNSSVSLIFLISRYNHSWQMGLYIF